jgi:hypothetical protein
MHVDMGRDGWYLCRWLDPAAAGDQEFIGNEASALRFLLRFGLSPHAMKQLRKEVARPGTQAFSDDEILNYVSWELARGRWRARQRPREWETGTTGNDVQGPLLQAAVPFPLAPKPSPPPVASSPRPEPAVFPDDIDAAAIAATLKSAAEQGAPFCEECLAAAAAAGRS